MEIRALFLALTSTFSSSTLIVNRLISSKTAEEFSSVISKPASDILLEYAVRILSFSFTFEIRVCSSLSFAEIASSLEMMAPSRSVIF